MFIIFIHFPCKNQIGSQLHFFLKSSFFNFSKPSKRLQPVRSVASGGKFYWLLPDKGNTGYLDNVDHISL